MEKKHSKGKLKIAALILSVALIAALGAIFGVYAATQQNVKSSFSVSYSIGKNVAVAIGAKTSATPLNGSWNWIWFESDKELTKNANNLYEIGINSSDQNLNLSLPEENNVLDVAPMYDRLIVFYFENLSDKAVNVTMVDTCTIEGSIEVRSRCYGYTTDTSTPPGDATNDIDLSKSMQIPAGKICVIYIQIALEGRGDWNKSASYTSNENGGISFRFEQA